jgi:hypothetical protein
VSKAQPYSVLVKLTERQWRLLQEAAARQDKGPEWMAHRILTSGIEDAALYKAVRGNSQGEG